MSACTPADRLHPLCAGALVDRLNAPSRGGAGGEARRVGQTDTHQGGRERARASPGAGSARAAPCSAERKATPGSAPMPPSQAEPDPAPRGPTRCEPARAGGALAARNGRPLRAVPRSERAGVGEAPARRRMAPKRGSSSGPLLAAVPGAAREWRRLPASQGQPRVPSREAQPQRAAPSRPSAAWPCSAPAHGRRRALCGAERRAAPTPSSSRGQ